MAFASSAFPLASWQLVALCDKMRDASRATSRAKMELEEHSPEARVMPKIRTPLRRLHSIHRSKKSGAAKRVEPISR